MSAANATVMRPVSVFLPGRVLTETSSVTVACRGNRKKMGEKVTFIANATVFNVSDEKTDRYKGRYRSVGCHVTPVQKLRDAIAQNITDYRTQNGMTTNAAVPADAVTGSGSGLDPHISSENARLQADRVAKARGLTPERVRELIPQNTDHASLGILGDPGVNVLTLNLALDAIVTGDGRTAMAGSR